jgi:WD40 repeat protein
MISLLFPHFCDLFVSVTQSDIRTGKLVRRVVGAHHAEINCVRIWGNRIITASNDSTLKIWTVG